MEQTDNADNFIYQYRAISAKIRKRFLRKPNVAEASEEFSKLACKLRDGEAWPQAALCCIAVARCEQTLQNQTTEVASLIEAARNFMKAEHSNQILDCPHYNEHMISSVSSYQVAINIYCEQNKFSLAASLAMELSMSLCSLGRSSEGLLFLQEAANHLECSPIDSVTCHYQIASCKIDLGDLDGALKEFFIILDLINYPDDTCTGAMQEIIIRCEVSALLIILTLQPLPTQLKPEHSRILNKFNPIGSQSTSNHETQELDVILQSLVMACQSHDLTAIKALGQMLTPTFSGQVLSLLHILLTEMKRS